MIIRYKNKLEGMQKGKQELVDNSVMLEEKIQQKKDFNMRMKSELQSQYMEQVYRRRCCHVPMLYK